MAIHQSEMQTKKVNGSHVNSPYGKMEITSYRKQSKWREEQKAMDNECLGRCLEMGEDQPVTERRSLPLRQRGGVRQEIKFPPAGN